MRRYHITRREDGQHQVKRENAGRASKRCSTQAEAIKYAKKYSDNAPDGGVVLVHAERNTKNYRSGEIRDCVTGC